MSSLRIGRERNRNRNRVVYGLATVAAILLGLASRRYAHLLPAMLGKYPGDALWAVMVFFGYGAMRPRVGTLNAAVVALLCCFTIETLKLWQAPYLVSLRHSTIGALVFGHVFSFENLLAYTVGVVLALGLEALALRVPSVRAPH